MVAPQILQVNISTEANSNLSSWAAENHLLLTRDPAVTTQIGEQSQVDICDQEGGFKEGAIAAEIKKILRSFDGNKTIIILEDTVQAIVYQRDGFGRRKYSRKKRVIVSANFEWDQTNQVSVRQTIYSNASTMRGVDRFDCVMYREDKLTFIGMVQTFLKRLPTRRDGCLSGGTVALLRVFKKVEAMEGNRVIVEKFNYERVALECLNGDARIVRVTFHKIMRRVVVLIDMCDAALQYSARRRVTEITDTVKDPISARFFVAKNIQFSCPGDVSQSTLADLQACTGALYYNYIHCANLSSRYVDELVDRQY